MINKKRIRQELETLIRMDAPSYGERQVADYLKEKLSALGFQVSEDGAGELLGSDTGNIYGFLPGTLPGAPILLSAHMDTVEPALGKVPVFHEDGSVTSAGNTVLGADDVAGIVEILEGIRHLQEENIPHRSVEVLFAVAEEAYGRGSQGADYGRIQAKEAYVFDLEGVPGTAAVKAPTLIKIRASVRGKAAHAGFAPEEGIHAIRVMCDCICQIPQGRVEEGTTLNLGLIKGGTAVNIVPEFCVCEGEIRSFDHGTALRYVEHLRKIFRETAKAAKAEGEVEVEIVLTAYETAKEAPVTHRFQAACERLGLAGRLTETLGGSDNNHFAAHGIEGIVLSCGMHDVHSVREYTTMQDLAQGAALAAELLKEIN